MTLGESRVERVGVTATPARAVCWRACRPGRWWWWWCNRWPRLSSTAAARAAGRTRSRSAAHGRVRCSRTMIGRAWRRPGRLCATARYRSLLVRHSELTVQQQHLRPGREVAGGLDQCVGGAVPGVAPARRLYKRGRLRQGMAHSWLHRHPTSSCDLACPPAATLSSQLIPCHLPSATHGRAANGRPAHASPRSAGVCPPGASQGAGAAQGLWGPSTAGPGQHHPDRVLSVGLPGGMDRHRPGPRPGPNPAADHLVIQ
jgi:hypothetical protein